jgi:hypothetical protein
VQRALYPVLLCAATAVAVAVTMRPSTGVELISLAESWSARVAAAGDPSPTAIPGTDGYSVLGSQPVRPVAAARPASWPYQPPDPESSPDAMPSARPQGAAWQEAAEVPEAEPWPPRRPTERYDERIPQGTPSDATRRDSDAPDHGSGPAAAVPSSDVEPLERQIVAAGPGELPPGAVPCEGAQIAARVGAHAILVSDVWISAEEILVRNRDKIPPEAVPQQREILIQQNFRPLLNQLVETKLAYYDALSTIPAEGLKNAEDQIGRIFDKTEIPKLMELFGAKSQRELDARLMTHGTSVHRHRRAFLERTLSQQWVRQKIKIDEDVNHEEMRAYYRDHAAQFEQPAQARWEQLMVRVSRHPSKEAARAALAQMGNQVLDGRPLAEVAREQSDGPTARQGGLRDWTTQGSLVSQMLDRAIFGLPLGALSPILEDNGTLHIVRVIERRDVQRTSFVDAQVKIREGIREQRNRVQQQAYIDRLRHRVPVWTMFDGRSPNGAPDGGPDGGP